MYSGGVCEVKNRLVVGNPVSEYANLVHHRVDIVARNFSVERCVKHGDP